MVQEDWKQFLKDGTCDHGDGILTKLKLVSLVLGNLKECPIESEHALSYNAYKEYVKTGKVGDIGPTTLDMLWLLLYITGDTFYAEEVKNTKNVMVASAALWSYSSHYSKPEMYGVLVRLFPQVY
jgi:hypothetical protein